MDFFGLFLGIFGRLFFGQEVDPAPSLGGSSMPLKEGAMPDPDG